MAKGYRDYNHVHSAILAAKKYGIKGATRGAIGGAALGGAAGAASPLPTEYDSKTRGQRIKKRFIKGFKGAVGGGLIGGYLGANAGANYGAGHHHQQDEHLAKAFRDRLKERLAKNNPSHLTKHLENMGLSKVPKSKEEIHKAYRSASMRAHPDRGGKAEDFHKLHKSYKDLQDSSWFKKLSTPSWFGKARKAAKNLPTETKALAKIPHKKPKMDGIKWKAGFWDKAKAHGHVEPELAKHYRTNMAFGAGAGALSGSVTALGERNALDQDRHRGKISKEEYERAKKKTGVLGRAGRAAAVGAGTALGFTHGMSRKAPVAGLLAGRVGGMAAGMYAPAFEPGRHDPTIRKARERLHQRVFKDGKNPYD
jgi:hypothetical protein